MAETPSFEVSLNTDLPDTRRAQLTRDLGRELSRLGVQSVPERAPPIPGERGEPITVGVLVLSLITHGAATAMIDCLKAFLAREHTLVIKLARQDGTSVEVNAHNIDMPAVRKLLETVSTKST